MAFYNRTFGAYFAILSTMHEVVGLSVYYVEILD